IKLGISRCLVGDKVRYDGRHKRSSVCCHELSSLFQLIPICPEVESGLPVPRPPVELVQQEERVRAIGRDDPSMDVTSQLIDFCEQKKVLLSSLSGFILTPRSPSCGLGSTPIKLQSDLSITEIGNGLFANHLLENFPHLPLIEETELSDYRTIKHFQLRVILYKRCQDDNLVGMSELLDKIITTEFHTDFQLETLENKMRVLNNILNKLSTDKLDNLLNQIEEGHHES
ncbi:MAG: DUF523 domain-containing protein, partial [Cycloclasticus sp.]|nr:DUF523 domain-containing protein [Cycloclasticus sp.]